MLKWLEVKPLYSRPRVSDDNVFAEGLFRTAKHRPDFPAKTFASRIQKNTHGRHYIVVEAGDTLFKIAQQSKRSEAKLTQLNKLKTKNVPLDTRLYLD